MNGYNCRRHNLIHIAGILTVLAALAGSTSALVWNLKTFGHGPAAGILFVLGLVSIIASIFMAIWLQGKAEKCPGHGKNDIENLQLMCEPCNLSKGESWTERGVQNAVDGDRPNG